MCSSFWLLGVESLDFSQAEKETTACKAVQIHKTTTFFTQNDNLGPFWVKIVVILWICLSLQLHQLLEKFDSILKSILCSTVRNLLLL